ncbi:hypothetical protein HMPREF1222_02248 [Treponema vincentii F0403]|uniref:Uncharacterized protein n=1 Tax=Treponema vincentii F0403 TaxID=1125702 RepID=S3MAA5_9SPIR|nr:hypothetical protein [Treponema vincentii]EPF45959.1 hypothetical protein HMPREF1222_02248 [Treponema vincentii F0403]
MDKFNKTDDLYDPNFSIDSDSTEKLDMYGVWLKKKKDSIEPLDSDDSQIASDSGIEDQNDINFDDDFSFSNSDMDTDIKAPELEELNDINSLDTVPLETDSSSYTGNDSSDVPLDEDSFESLDLDDFLSDEGSPEPQEVSETFVEEEPIDLDFTEMTDDTEKPMDNDTPPAGLENFSEISLDDFEDAAPSDSSGSDGNFEPVDDFDDIIKGDTTEEQNSEQKEKPVLDINVTADDEAAKVQPLSELSSQVVEDNADIPIFGTHEDKEDKTDSKTADTEEPAFFDDIEAVKQDLLSTPQNTEHTNETEPTAPAPAQETKDSMNTTAETSQHPAAEQDKATELLMKIAHEISDLKAELNNLKATMTAQSKTVAESSVKDTGNPQTEKNADTESSGFFSDDDTDETIALTGDELNNILITADFTEERNSEDGERAPAEETQAAEEENENYEVPPVLTKDIDPDMEETPPADHSFEDSIAEPEPVESDGDYKPEAEGEKLLASDPVFNVEAAPITSLPEDLSYLDESSEVPDEGEELIDNDSSDQETAELEEIGEAEPADEESDFEDINIESFDIPSEQEIEVPNIEPIAEEPKAAAVIEAEPETEEVRFPAEVTEERTIHELQNDEDFPNPFADASTASEAEIKEEIIEEPFVADAPVIESAAEETGHEAPIEELDAIPELEPEEEGNSKEPKQETLLQAATKKREATISIPLELKNEIKSVLSYMDQLLEALPEKKIEEFAKSEYFETYKHLFEELGIS